METIDLAKASLAQLLAEQQVAADLTAAAKERAGAVKSELARRFAASTKEALRQSGKDHGTFTLPMQDGFKLKGEAKQTVSWDSDKLMAVARELPFERVEALFNIKFSMSEKIYAGVSALSPELRQKIDEARTTKIAEPTIALVKEV